MGKLGSVSSELYGMPFYGVYESRILSSIYLL